MAVPNIQYSQYSFVSCWRSSIHLVRYFSSSAVILSKQILSKNSCKWWVIVDNTFGGETAADKIRITEISDVSIGTTSS